MKYITLIVLVSIYLSSCTAPKAISTATSYNFDAKNNQTVFIKIPFGTVNIPGEWSKISYNDVSGQHNFRNADSILTAVAINQTSSYPFYKKDMTPNVFVKEFYEWDSQYLAERIKGTRSIIKQDTVNHFIIWRVIGHSKRDNYYLFGSENNIVFTVYLVTDKWTDEQKMDFVETVYKNKTVGKCCN